jgi:cell division septation protein DedD
MATRQRRQLQFTGFELAMIAVSFVLTVTAVFFLGLYVGKKNASYHAPAEDRVARIPVDDFTRYKRPAPIEKPAKRPPAEDAAAAPSGQAAPEAAKPATEPANVPATSTAAMAPVPAVAPPTPASPAAVTEKAPKDAAAEAAAAKEAAKAKEAAAAAAKEKEKAKEEAEADTGRGYTVQILSTRKQAEADALVKKLKSHGYAAYIKKVSEGEGAWFRVRVGSYGAFGEAKGMADKCRRDLGLGQAFVSTE